MSFKKSSWVLVVSLLTNFIFSGQHASAYLENKPIFYMWAKPGCYSATLKSSPTIPLQSLKKLYPVSCLSPHHFEVFYAGQFKTKDGRIGAGGKEVVSACLAKSKEFAFNQRNSSSYNWSQDEEDLIGNWMADMGVEAQRFPNRNICYVSVTTKSWFYIKELNLPIIRGFEKYDN
jgi:hypothetical protein